MLQLIHRLVFRFFPRLYNPLLFLYRRFLDRDTRRIQAKLARPLSELLSKYPTPILISVGSNDGISNDPFVDWILTSECEAHLIEPVPYLYEQLIQNYKRLTSNTSRIHCHPIAISDETSKSTLFAVSELAKNDLGDKVPVWFNQLSSFDRSHITNHLDGILEPYIEELQVDTFTLDGFLRLSSIAYIDVLHIDTEGHDYKVLSTLNLDQYCPKIIMLEHKHLCGRERTQIDMILRNHSYELNYFVSDLIAIRRDD